MSGAILEVLEPGALTTVQDGGRRGWARYGIPPSGPMDPVAMAIANRLVGNPVGSAALEITLTGPVLRAYGDLLIAVCGAEFDVWVERLNVPLWCSVFVRDGAVIKFSTCHKGMRAYLAVAGGIQVPTFLGSAATYLPAGFGGLGGRALTTGDQFHIGEHPVSDLALHAGQRWPMERRPTYHSPPTLRVVPGPQADVFEPDTTARFFDSCYKVTTQSNRMGIRLSGPTLMLRHAASMVSDGVIAGSIQVPPDGQPIVMMADHQTTGGYPKIATVIWPDLPLIAQCLPGTDVRFRSISWQQAVEAHRATRARLGL